MLGDPTVRMFGIRDLDMFMLPRERAAVASWERGEDQFYIMRDTPQARNRAGILMPIKVSIMLTLENGQKMSEWRDDNFREAVGVETTTWTST